MSTSKRLTIYQRVSLNFQPKSSASGNALSNNLPRDWQSPALNNAKSIFHWHRTSGVGRPECSWNSSRWSYWHSDHRRYQSKHPWFQRYFEAREFYLQKIKSNKQDAEDLVIRTSNLMEPIPNALQNKTLQDIDPSLVVDLRRCQK